MFPTCLMGFRTGVFVTNEISLNSFMSSVHDEIFVIYWNKTSPLGNIAKIKI